MFEKEIKYIYDLHLNKIKKLGPYFTINELEKSKIHPALFHYISAEIDYMVFEDRQNLLKNSIFDYSGETIGQYFSLITEEVKRKKKFSLKYFAGALLKATIFNINYIVTPRKTLVNLLYEDTETRSSQEIKEILNHLYYYTYLKNVTVSFINNKKLLSLGKEEFTGLVNKIDELTVEDNRNNVVNNALSSMADFFNIGDSHKESIPVSAVKMFLEEKQLTPFLEKLDVAVPGENRTKFDLVFYKSTFSAIPEEVYTHLDKEEEEKEEELPVFDEPGEDIKAEEEPDTGEEVEAKSEPAEEAPEPEDEPEERPEDRDEGDESKKKISEDAAGQEPQDGYDDVEVAAAGMIQDDDGLEETDEREEDEVNDFSLEDFDSLTAEEDVVNDDEAEKQKNSVTGFTPEENTSREQEQDSADIDEVFEEFELPELTDDDFSTEDQSDIGEDELTMLQEDDWFDNTEDEEKTLDTPDKTISEGSETEEDNYDETEIFEDDIPEETEETFPDEETEELNIEDEPEPDDIEIIDHESEEEFDEDDPDLFGDTEIDSRETPADEPFEDKPEPVKRKIEAADLFENKRMPRIVEEVFDYDMEELDDTLDYISRCASEEEAFGFIDKVFERNGINSSSRTASEFKKMISEYF